MFGCGTAMCAGGRNREIGRFWTEAFSINREIREVRAGSLVNQQGD
jgi:hypothetical protein